MALVFIKTGSEVNGPNGMGYRFVEDWVSDQSLTMRTVTPYGGAPSPLTGDVIPEWFVRAIANEAST